MDVEIYESYGRCCAWKKRRFFAWVRSLAEKGVRDNDNLGNYFCTKTSFFFWNLNYCYYQMNFNMFIRLYEFTIRLPSVISNR